jgi:hypothetical protein
MTDRTFTDLREQLFRADPAALASAEDEGSSNVVGVIVEEGIEGGSYLVYGLRDGSASLYLSSGGGWLGGQEQPHINAAAKHLVGAAKPFANQFPLVGEHPIPATGKVRFSFVTTEGVRAAESDTKEFQNERGELLPVFLAAQQVIAGFRALDERNAGDEGPANEPGYVNCLLTTLGRGTASSVTLTEGELLPDPSRLTNDVLDLEWIARMNFALDRLSSTEVIRSILHLAGYRWFRLGKAEGHITAKLADHGGGSFTDVSFRVLRRRQERRTRVEIVPQRSASTGERRD